MLIDINSEGSQHVVSVLESRLDAASAVEFKETVMRNIEEGNTNLIIDLKEVEFIDSSGLGALVAILKSVSLNGTLAITGLHKKTEQIFKLTRMDTVFQIFPSVTEALEAA